jgi:hypothetical protein
MQGRNRFTKQEAAEIKQILREKATADRSRQKGLRGQLRREYNFYISDFRSDAYGFTAMAFEDLVRTGAITIEAEGGLSVPGIELGILYDDPPHNTGEQSGGQRDPLALDSVSTRRETGDPWYEELRASYRPAEVRYLLIGESPPDPGSMERRFFYSSVLSQYDNLYRGVAEAMYGLDPGFDVTRKVTNLDRLKSDGFWLIDAVEHPVNKGSASARRAAIRSAVPGLIGRCQEVSPRLGIIICHTLVYDEAALFLQEAGLRLLHDRPIPFPLGNWRATFIEDVRRAISQALNQGSA